MSIVGFDFSTAAAPVFHKVVVDRFTSEMQMCLANFKSIILTEKLLLSSESSNIVEQVVPLYQPQGTAVTSDSNGNGIDKRRSTSTGSTETAPSAPVALLQYPPLAYVLNCILHALNFVRECTLVSTREHLFGAIQALCEETCRYLASVASDVRSRGAKYLTSLSADNRSATDENKKRMDDMYGIAITEVLVPHVCRCFAAIYCMTSGEADKLVDTLVSGCKRELKK